MQSLYKDIYHVHSLYSNIKLLVVLCEPERYMFYTLPPKSVFLFAGSVIIHAML